MPTLAVIGHVDHGKTALVKALTGVDTDRLPEEKRRNLTIEPGFAPLQLEDSTTISVVDDPGHERFISNLLAASGGVDALLLVVDAVQGPQPQTWEHLALLTYLGVTRGVTALTKTDLLPETSFQERMDRLSQTLSGTILEGAPILPVSAKTGGGLSALRAALGKLTASCPPRPAGRPFRLPMDRVFSIPGFGTVVTGTVWEGKAVPGGEVQLYPSERTAALRKIQCRGHDVDTAAAGDRAALNLAGVETGRLRRGMTAAALGSLILTTRLNAQISLWERADGPLRSGTSVRVFCGADSVIGRAYPFPDGGLVPGGTGFVQLRLHDPLALRPFDRLILRRLSPASTLGGGPALDLWAGRTRDLHASETLSQLVSEGYPALAGMLLERSDTPLSLLELSLKMGLSVPETQHILDGLENARPVPSLSGGQKWVSQALLDRSFAYLQELCLARFRARPLAPGVGREEVRASVSEEVLRFFAAEGKMVLHGPWVSLPGQTPVWPESLLPIREKLIVLYDEYGLHPPESDAVAAAFGRDAALCRQAARRLEEEGTLIAYAPGRRISALALQRAETILRERLAVSPEITLAQFRDAAGINRDAALRLLDYFDRIRLTRRVGNVRKLIPPKE